MTNRQGPLSTKVRANDQPHLQRGAPASRRHLQGAVGILPTSFDSRAPPARSTLRAKSFAARVPIQNGYKSSPFFLSLDSYRLASCPDAARGADALKKDAEPRMNANILFPRQTEYFLRKVLCALHCSAFRFFPAISRTVSLGFHTKRDSALRGRSALPVKDARQQESRTQKNGEGL